jgi:cobalt-zinc-cadmium efflux system membrane fusion protein
MFLRIKRGAIASTDLQVAEDTEAKAKVTAETTLDHLRVLGADPNNPSAIVDVRAPVSGVITDQQVTAGAGTQGLASPKAFTISDLSHVWILCDVFRSACWKTVRQVVRLATDLMVEPEIRVSSQFGGA